MANLNIRCPDYTTLSKRCKVLDFKIPTVSKNLSDEAEEKIITLDSSGLKQYRIDEWHQEKHKINS